MQLTKRISAFFAIVVAVIVVDQVTKQIAVNRLYGEEPIIFLNGMAKLLYAENTGAFLSLGARLPENAQRWVFIGAVTVILLSLLVYAMKEIRTLTYPLLIGFALIFGGGVGNLIDRIVNDGSVIDFMNVGIGSLRTGIFNVADMSLMAGVGLILIFAFTSHSEEEPDTAEPVTGGTANDTINAE